jgi:hypothetical protein
MKFPSLLRVVSIVLLGCFPGHAQASDSIFDKPNLAVWCIMPWDGARKLVDAVHQASGKIQGTAFVSSEGLHRQGDRLHFDAALSRELGKRDAEEFQKLTAGK